MTASGSGPPSPGRPAHGGKPGGHRKHYEHDDPFLPPRRPELDRQQHADHHHGCRQCIRHDSQQPLHACLSCDCIAPAAPPGAQGLPALISAPTGRCPYTPPALPVLITAAVSLAGCIAGWWLGPRVGLVDRPDGTALKPHRRPVAPLGGLGIFLGLHAGLAAAGLYDAGLAAATGLVFVLGLVDDRWEIPPAARLAVEIGAGVVVAVAADLAVDGWGGGVLVVVLVVAAINAVNLFDGLDGLVGSATVVAGLGLWAVAGVRNIDGTFGLVAAAAAGAFLVFNWNPARLFLGDNGAYVVGVVLAYGVVAVTPSGNAGRTVVAAAVLGVFGWDLAVTILRRGRAGRPLFAGDRSHIYDQLHDRGWPVRRVAAAAGTFQAVFIGGAVVADAVLPSGVAAAVVVAAAAGLVGAAVGAGFLRVDE